MLFQFKKNLAQCTHNGTSITAYFTKVRTMMDDLDTPISLTKCTCKIFTCGATAQLISYQQRMKVTQFLMGLDHQYTSLSGHILMQQPLPSVI